MNSIAYTLVKSEGHSRPGHPEHPDRFEHFDKLADSAVATQLHKIEPAAIEEGDLEVVHTRDYLDAVARAVGRAPALLDLGDTYLTAESLDAARQATGAALAATRATLDDPEVIGFSLARPPGHHATAHRGMGFCLLNHIAVAARAAQRNGIERILIVDFDVHHGNGTQEIFYEDPAVLYLSFHQRGIFPGTGKIDETGIGEGRGTTINVPLPARTAPAAYLEVFSTILDRASDRHSPELILVSAGYDAHWQDPLARLQLTGGTYHQLGRTLRQCAEQHCGGRLSLILEGGYHPEALYDSVVMTMGGLLGTDAPQRQPARPDRPAPDLTELLERVLQQHSMD